LAPQKPELVRGQLEHEVRGETFRVPPDGAVERLGLDAEKAGKVAVEHDLLAAGEQNGLLDALDRDEVGGHGTGG